MIMVRGEHKRRKGAFIFVRLSEGILMTDISPVNISIYHFSYYNYNYSMNYVYFMLIIIPVVASPDANNGNFTGSIRLRRRFHRNGKIFRNTHVKQSKKNSQSLFKIIYP